MGSIGNLVKGWEAAATAAAACIYYFKGWEAAATAVAAAAVVVYGNGRQQRQILLLGLDICLDCMSANTIKPHDADLMSRERL
jgi:hypothetical protein